MKRPHPRTKESPSKPFGSLNVSPCRRFRSWRDHWSGSERAGTASPAAISAKQRSNSANARREKAAQREMDAAHDRLTVQARLAVVSARKLTTAQLDELFDRALDRAKGDGHVANAAFAQVMSLYGRAVRDALAPTPMTGLSGSR